jgi:hypothetical protein
VIGALIAGCIGGAVGLGLGLSAHPPTAWFAILEVGIPSAVIGTWLGLAAGCMAIIVKRVRERPHGP